jgi:hypothetical protein
MTMRILLRGMSPQLAHSRPSFGSSECPLTMGDRTEVEQAAEVRLPVGQISSLYRKSVRAYVKSPGQK